MEDSNANVRLLVTTRQPCHEVSSQSITIGIEKDTSPLWGERVKEIEDLEDEEHEDDEL